MHKWEYINISEPKPLYSVEGASNEPIDIYSDRYVQPPIQLQYIDAWRYIDEILMGLSGSILVIGSGHSSHVNSFYQQCEKLRPFHAADFVEEASLGLVEGVTFHNQDILKWDPGVDSYDYIFSSHTLEHFPKDLLLHTVWPKLNEWARKAIITVVPYGEHWKDEPSHHCRFYEDDEFAARNSKYKIIWEGKEIVYWKDI